MSATATAIRDRILRLQGEGAGTPPQPAPPTGEARPSRLDKVIAKMMADAPSDRDAINRMAGLSVALDSGMEPEEAVRFVAQNMGRVSQLIYRAPMYQLAQRGPAGERFAGHHWVNRKLKDGSPGFWRKNPTRRKATPEQKQKVQQSPKAQQIQEAMAKAPKAAEQTLPFRTEGSIQQDVIGDNTTLAQDAVAAIQRELGIGGDFGVGEVEAERIEDRRRRREQRREGAPVEAGDPLTGGKVGESEGSGAFREFQSSGEAIRKRVLEVREQAEQKTSMMQRVFGISGPRAVWAGLMAAGVAALTTAAVGAAAAGAPVTVPIAAVLGAGGFGALFSEATFASTNAEFRKDWEFATSKWRELLGLPGAVGQRALPIPERVGLSKLARQSPDGTRKPGHHWVNRKLKDGSPGFWRRNPNRRASFEQKQKAKGSEAAKKIQDQMRGKTAATPSIKPGKSIPKAKVAKALPESGWITTQQLRQRLGGDVGPGQLEDAIHDAAARGQIRMGQWPGSARDLPSPPDAVLLPGAGLAAYVSRGPADLADLRIPERPSKESVLGALTGRQVTIPDLARKIGASPGALKDTLRALHQSGEIRLGAWQRSGREVPDPRFAIVGPNSVLLYFVNQGVRSDA